MHLLENFASDLPPNDVIICNSGKRSIRKSHHRPFSLPPGRRSLTAPSILECVVDGAFTIVVTYFLWTNLSRNLIRVKSCRGSLLYAMCCPYGMGTLLELRLGMENWDNNSQLQFSGQRLAQMGDSDK